MLPYKVAAFPSGRHRHQAGELKGDVGNLRSMRNVQGRTSNGLQPGGNWASAEHLSGSSLFKAVIRTVAAHRLLHALLGGGVAALLHPRGKLPAQRRGHGAEVGLNGILQALAWLAQLLQDRVADRVQTNLVVVLRTGAAKGGAGDSAEAAVSGTQHHAARVRTSLLLVAPSGVPCSASAPGSLNQGSSTRIIAWIDTSTCGGAGVTGRRMLRCQSSATRSSPLFSGATLPQLTSTDSGDRARALSAPGRARRRPGSTSRWRGRRATCRARTGTPCRRRRGWG